MLCVMFGYRARKHLSVTDQEFKVFNPAELDVETARKHIAEGRKKDVIVLVEDWYRGLDSIVLAILESRSEKRLAVFGYFGSGGAKYVDLVPADDYETEITRGNG